MKKIWKILVISCLVFGAGGLVGCDVPLNGKKIDDLVDSPNSVTSSNSNSVNVIDLVKSVGYWDYEKVEGNPNTIIIDLERDVDFLAWSRENGEFISLPIPRGKKFDATFKYEKGVRGFTFQKPGTYILTIHQKPDLDSGFNTEDFDFRGKVVIGEQAIKITDKGYACKSPKLAPFSINNDSNCKYYGGGAGNVMDELTYVMFKNDIKGKRKCKLYEAQYKYTDLSLQPGKNICLLFPTNQLSDASKGGLILKPVIQNGNTIYPGQTTNRAARYSIQGMNIGDKNNIFTPVSYGYFEANWNIK